MVNSLGLDSSATPTRDEAVLNPLALEALENNQRQLDMDGVEVGVSRQALDELLSAYKAAVARVNRATDAEIGGIHRSFASAPAPAIGRVDAVAEPVPYAWVRRFAYDGVDVMKMRKADRPRGWHLMDVTRSKFVDDDVPLYTREALSPAATPVSEADPEIEEEEEGVDWYNVDPKPCSRCDSDRTFLNSYFRPDSAEVCRVECNACGYKNAEGFNPETAIVQWDAQWEAKQIAALASTDATEKTDG